MTFRYNSMNFHLTFPSGTLYLYFRLKDIMKVSDDYKIILMK